MDGDHPSRGYLFPATGKWAFVPLKESRLRSDKLLNKHRRLDTR